MNSPAFNRDLEYFGLLAATIEGALEMLLANDKELSMLDEVDKSRFREGKLFLSRSLSGLDSINEPDEFFVAGGKKEKEPTCLNWALKTYIDLNGFNANLESFRDDCNNYIEVLNLLLENKIPTKNIETTLTFFSAVADKSLAQDLSFAVGDY